MLAFPPDFRQDDRLKNVRDSTGDDLGMLQEKQRSLQFIQERFHLEEEDLDILFSLTQGCKSSFSQPSNHPQSIIHGERVTLDVIL
jgi:hypothetical protein